MLIITTDNVKKLLRTVENSLMKNHLRIIGKKFYNFLLLGLVLL